MTDTETKYQVHYRIQKLPLTIKENKDYLDAWHSLMHLQSQYFGDNSRVNMRLMNAAYIHWHTMAEDLEMKYRGGKTWGM